ncbi:MAG: hypothetical protein INH37_06985 [Myxococcaceae bacterium]|nr:hypothetical protein [Myxococcaceae bacterium]
MTETSRWGRQAVASGVIRGTLAGVVNRPFPTDERCVFLSAPHLSGEAALLAAARVHVKPAALAGPLPRFAFSSSDASAVDEVLEEARSVDVDAWALSLADAQPLERLRRVERVGARIDLVTTGGQRPLDAATLGAFVDLRWKTVMERRVQVVLPRAGPALLVVPGELEVTGPSRQAAELQVMVDLQRRAMGVGPTRTFTGPLLPTQLNAPRELPAELAALALAESLRRRNERLAR